MIALLVLACAKRGPEVAPTPTPAPAASPAPAEAPAALARAWISTFRTADPKVGRIWSVRAARWATWDELVADLRTAAVVGLGEKHDNADHHALQAELLAAVHPKTAVFEHLDHTDPVDATDPDALAAAVKWDESGWPDFAIYRPIFEAVFASGARIVGPHPTRDEVKAAMADAAFPLDALPPASLEDLAREIEESHCGMATPELVAKMTRGQLFKDRAMADAIRAAEAPVVLVAGTGHTRRDRGVPAHLAGLEVRTVQLREVGDEVEPGAYDEGGDWLVFTPRHDEDDPCAAFRR